MLPRPPPPLVSFIFEGIPGQYNCTILITPVSDSGAIAAVKPEVSSHANRLDSPQCKGLSPRRCDRGGKSDLPRLLHLWELR
jgi:hypothetical protein